MSEITSERLAELREMHRKATPGHVTDDKYACMVYADRTETALATALRNSASALFDLAQEALDARGKNSPADELLRALKELREWHKREYQSNQFIDLRVDAAISRYEEKR